MMCMSRHTPSSPEDQAALLAVEHERPVGRRGRPSGTKTRIAHSQLTADEFAVLRAVRQGLDVVASVRRYMLFPGRIPEHRVLLQSLLQLLARIDSAAADKGLTQPGLKVALADLRTELTRQLSPAPQDGQAANLAPQIKRPTLEEYALQFDEDMYSQDELLELYEEAYPQVEGAAPMPQGRESTSLGDLAGHTEIIQWLSFQLARTPERTHQVYTWLRFSKAEQDALRAVGVLDLGNLVDWISLTGPRWFKQFPRWGTARAEALQDWLNRNQIAPTQGLVPIANQAHQIGQPTLQPLLTMAWPAELRGDQGLYRSNTPNTYKAANDQEAVHEWFRSISEQSPETQRAYRRAIERLVLWAVVEKQIPLSSLGNSDLREFRDFLLNPPAHWVRTSYSVPKKSSPHWRPLNGPLSQKNLTLTFAAIGSMYSAWVSANYLTANPCARMQTGVKHDLKMDVRRSFNKLHIQVMREAFNALPAGPVKNRLRAIILTLELTGLRRSELSNATWRDVSHEYDEEKQAEYLLLRVIGKGNKERFVPLNAAVVAALLEHKRDRVRLASAGVLSRYKSLPENEMPLIGVLDEKWIETQNKKNAADWQVGGNNKVTVNEDGRLSSSGIYSELAKFFKQCASMANASQGTTEAFERATTHWFRHTFAKNALKQSRGDLSIVKSLVGHEDINTTAIYVSADLSERARLIAALQGSI